MQVSQFRFEAVGSCLQNEQDAMRFVGFSTFKKARTLWEGSSFTGPIWAHPRGLVQIIWAHCSWMGQVRVQSLCQCPRCALQKRLPEQTLISSVLHSLVSGALANVRQRWLGVRVQNDVVLPAPADPFPCSCCLGTFSSAAGHAHRRRPPK